MVKGESGRGEFRPAGSGCAVRLAGRTSLILVGLFLAACQQSVMVRPAPSAAAPDGSPRDRMDERASEAPSYTVQSGDTLYKISVQYGVDYRDLARWNDISPPYTIYPRQRLRVGAFDSAPETGAVASVSSPRVAAAETASARTPPAGAERIGGAAVATTSPGYDPNLGVTLPEGAEPLTTSASPPAFESGVPASVATSAAATSANTAAAAASTAVQTASTSAAAAAPTTTVTPAAAAAPAPTPAAAAPVSAAPAAGDIASAKPSAAGWIWPTTGKVVVTYANGDPTRQGIDIAGDLGQPVRAARDGEVVYSGAGLIGYGELVIVKHSPELLSAYGHNRTRLVKEGDKVKAGQKIAEMGKSSSNRVLLHFEVRKNGKPVDPMPLLPAR